MDALTLLFIVLAGAAFYFLIIRPNQRRQKAQRDMLSSVGPGTEVMTTAGVFGTIVSSNESELGLEIAPGVIMRILPAAVARVITEPSPALPPSDIPPDAPPVD